ncbi:hypothetical protein [Variovorax sp. MHTC-1]|uniref:hypothetical protein n=1 Tax=Variovorax sp. MHTC-1 TaxID=2495593 RepID=UPI00163BDDC1|nr:hypothetical protein [Variovorax sp. MHTC-1]
MLHAATNFFDQGEQLPSRDDRNAIVEQRLNGARVAQMFLDRLAAYADMRCSVDLPPERPRDS